MSNRYFSETAITTDTAALSGGEAHHLARVMRARVGDDLILFDGSGAEFVARIERLTKAAVELRIQERREVDRELPFRLTLAVALPKGDRQRWLVEKAVELGVSRLVPLVTTRGVADGRAALDRLRRAVIEASKQCGRNRLMEVATHRAWSDGVVAPGERNCQRLFAHPADGGRPNASDGCSGQQLGEVVIAVGPEGGWTEQEVALARDIGWRFVDLGPRILRVETAAIALASVIVSRVS
jgi:16S rRNA (uracil1498-N3)-methyltransferase